MDTGLAQTSDRHFLLLLLMIIVMGCWYGSGLAHGEIAPTADLSNMRSSYLEVIRASFMDMSGEDGETLRNVFRIYRFVTQTARLVSYTMLHEVECRTVTVIQPVRIGHLAGWCKVECRTVRDNALVRSIPQRYVAIDLTVYSVP